MTLRLTVDIADRNLALDQNQLAELQKAVNDFVKGVVQPKIEADLFEPPVIHLHRHHSTDRSNCESCYHASGDEIGDPERTTGEERQLWT